MVPNRVFPVSLNRRGFSAAELLVVMAIVGIITATAVPWMITYWRAATLKAGAEELASGLNRARQLAISQSRSVCVEVTGSQYRFRLGGCGAAVWTGVGSDANGYFTLANNITVAVNTNPVFDYLGAAAPAATFTVTNPQGGATRSVVLSASGRIRIQ